MGALLNRHRVAFFLCFFLFISYTNHLFSTEDSIIFTNIGLEQGLSQVTVRDIIQDKKGFMWFVTDYGLNKYDGYDFTTYKHDSKNSNSLSDNWVNVILEDTGGILWIGTQKGNLDRFDPDRESFFSYKHDPADASSISSYGVIALLEISSPSSSLLFIGTKGGGMLEMDKKQGTFTHYLYQSGSPRGPASDMVYAIAGQPGSYGTVLWIATDAGLTCFDTVKKQFYSYIDPLKKNSPTSTVDLDTVNLRSLLFSDKNTLWLGTWGKGLILLDIKTGKKRLYTSNDSGPTTINDNYIQTLFADSFGNTWIGTEKGLTLYNREKDKFFSYTHDPLISWSVSDHQVLSIFEDRSKIMWVGTWNGAVNKFNNRPKKFTNYFHINGNRNSLVTDNVKSVFQDSNGIIWCGTTIGLDRFDRKNNRVTHFSHDVLREDTLSFNHIGGISEDSSGTLWVGSRRGLNRFDKEKGNFTRFLHSPANKKSLSSDYIIQIVEDRSDSNFLWVGTGDRGLNRMNKRNGSCRRYLYEQGNKNSISHNKVYCLFYQENGTMWLGTGGGLVRYLPEKDCFRNYSNQPGAPSLSNNRVVALAADPFDKENTIWAATWGGGLNKFDIKNERFTVFSEQTGLPTNMISGIMPGNNGFLWISTVKGVLKFHVKTEQFEHYDVLVGARFNAYNAGSFHKGAHGEMFMGGLCGLTAFFPEKIKNNPYLPPIALTSFKIFNKEIKTSPPLSESKRLTLSYKDKFFSFEFSGLEFTNQKKNRYKYMMEGFDEHWVETGAGKRFATYTNLDPGAYRFIVKGSNNDGVWNENSLAIQIFITPPFWKTVWFKVLVSLALLFIIITLYRLRIRAINKKSQRLEQSNKILNEQIVERKKAEQRISTFLETANEGFMEVDKDAFILDLNPEMSRILERPREEILGKKLFDFIAEDEVEALRNQLESRSRGQKSTYNLTFLNAAGNAVYCLIKASPLFDDGGQIKGSFAMIADITEQVRLQEMMIQSEKMLSVGGLAAGMAHEINNPLAGILQNMQVMKNRIKPEMAKNRRVAEECGVSVEGVRAYMEKRELLTMMNSVEESGRRASKIVENMLRFSRKSDMQFAFHDIAELLDKTLELASNDYDLKKKYDFRHISIVREYDDSLPGIQCEASEIQQVFLNLLKNGAQAMVESRPGNKSNCFFLRVKKRNHMAHIEIEDNGPGMDEATRKRIFEPFFTTKDVGVGTGLGLSVSYFIITENHGGTMTVESAPQKGAKFIIRLPMVRQDAI
ncbi:MAG: PAS domain S-box protein [bacterium]|nr:PAS domain S-box protein [bacterium]